MAWVFALWTHTSLARLLGLILLADLVVWASTKRLLAVRADKPAGFVDWLMAVLGSWSFLAFMAAWSIGWAAYVLSGNHSDKALNTIISVTTELLDVLVIIGANYTRQHDRKLLEDIRARLDKGP